MIQLSPRDAVAGQEGPLNNVSSEEIFIVDETITQSIETTEGVGTRKRLRHPELHKRNQHRGVFLRAKNGITDEELDSVLDRIQRDCCSKKCFELVSGQFVLNMQQKFAAADKSTRDSHIFSSIDVIAPVRIDSNSPSHSISSRFYITLAGGQRTRICKEAFVCIYGISPGVVERIARKKLDGISEGSPVSFADLRGRHANRPNRIADEVKQLVVGHIRSFPTFMSHYTRTKNPQKVFLTSNLSLRKMYLLFLEKQGEQDWIDYFTKVRASVYLMHMPLTQYTDQKSHVETNAFHKTTSTSTNCNIHRISADILHNRRP